MSGTYEVTVEDAQGRQHIVTVQAPTPEAAQMAAQRQFAPRPQARPQQRRQARIVSAGLGAADGLTANFTDEIAGNAWGAIAGQAAGQDVMRRIRRAQIEARQDNPLTYYGTGIAAGVGTTLALAAAAPLTGGASGAGAALAGGATAARSAGLLGSIGRGALAGAAYGGVAGFGDAQGNALQRAPGFAAGALGGAAAGGLLGAAVPAGMALARGAGRMVSGRTAAPVAAAAPEVQQAFASRAQELAASTSDELTGAMRARLDRAASFGVPLTRGQVLRGTAQGRRDAGFEAAAAAQARGQAAGDIMFDAQKAQQEALVRAQRGLVPNAPGTREARGEVIRSALGQRAQASRENYDQAYRALEGIPGTVRLDAAQGMMARIDDAFRGFDVDPAAPYARGVAGDAVRARQSIAETLQYWASREGQPVTPMEFEQLRRNVRRFIGNNTDPTDAALIMRMSDAVDEFAATQTDLFAPMAGREAEFAAALGSARDAFRAHQERFGGAVQRALSDKAPPVETLLADVLGGQRGAYGSSNAVANIRQMKMALDQTPDAPGPELDALRAEVLDRLVGRIDDAVTDDGVLPAARVRNDLDNFLDGTGSPIARELFTEAELQRLREFRDLANDFTDQPLMVNRSASGYERGRMEQDVAAGQASLRTAAARGVGNMVMGRVNADRVRRQLVVNPETLTRAADQEARRRAREALRLNRRASRLERNAGREPFIRPEEWAVGQRLSLSPLANFSLATQQTGAIFPESEAPVNEVVDQDGRILGTIEGGRFVAAGAY